MKGKNDVENIAQAEARGRQCAREGGAPESQNPYRSPTLRAAFKRAYFAEQQRLAKERSQ